MGSDENKATPLYFLAQLHYGYTSPAVFSKTTSSKIQLIPMVPLHDSSKRRAITADLLRLVSRGRLYKKYKTDVSFPSMEPPASSNPASNSVMHTVCDQGEWTLRNFGPQIEPHSAFQYIKEYFSRRSWWLVKSGGAGRWG
ncbi:hypothetical protein SKAU_G00168730 [Synaphobranchus kaupii]|uniref:Uncharacterized protein n=1 Tax=Synaphobranchus kaupii TaxID=118154 RepID=A0A9Q1J057_SYNKA|nr:hypothetical protein SKAU_G00168730 [Synaphobranchus kaupii]